MRDAGLGIWQILAKLQRKQPLPDFNAAAVREMVKSGWTYRQAHLITLDEQRVHLDVRKAVNRETSIGDLHWSIEHCYGLDRSGIEYCSNLGIGLSPHGSPYLVLG